MKSEVPRAELWNDVFNKPLDFRNPNLRPTDKQPTKTYTVVENVGVMQVWEQNILKEFVSSVNLDPPCTLGHVHKQS